MKWREKFWGRRARLIPVLDAQAQVQRLKYILSQGVQEGLVPRPELWPGVHCVHSLTTGAPMKGAWFNWTKRWFADRAGEEFGPRDFATPVSVAFAPLPCWEHLSAEEQRVRARDLVEEIIRENCTPGRSFLGVKKILAQNPHDFPKHTKRSKAPPCHASSKEQWKAYRGFFRALVALFEDVSLRFRQGLATLDEFPAYCYPPRHGFRNEGQVLLFDSAVTAPLH